MRRQPSMKVKATHQGTCQVCNATQKLPAGVLAKHGYEVAGWGFFNGVCFGSGHLPLEQDKSIVITSINRSNEYIQQLNGLVAIWDKQAVEPRAWFHQYVSARRNGYKWVMVDIVESNRGYQWITDDGRTNRAMTYGFHGSTALEIATKMNQKYVENIRLEIEQTERYIKRQEQHIEMWHEKPLQPIASDAERGIHLSY